MAENQLEVNLCLTAESRGLTAFMMGRMIAKGSTMKIGNHRLPQMAHTRKVLNAEDVSEPHCNEGKEGIPAIAKKEATRRMSLRTTCALHLRESMIVATQHISRTIKRTPGRIY